MRLTQEQEEALAMKAHEVFTAFFKDNNIDPDLALRILVAESDAIFSLYYMKPLVEKP